MIRSEFSCNRTLTCYHLSEELKQKSGINHTMKGLLLTSLAGILLSAVMGAENSFQDVEVDKVFSDEPNLKAAVSCLLDKEPCGELQPLRDFVPVLIQTDCSACTPKQKEKYENVMKTLSEKYPEMHKALMDKYSPKSH